MNIPAFTEASAAVHRPCSLRPSNFDEIESDEWLLPIPAG